MAGKNPSKTTYPLENIHAHKCNPLICNQGVTGSSPVIGTISRFLTARGSEVFFAHHGNVADAENADLGADHGVNR